MSTILKALRRLEDDEASRRAEQPAELREHLVSASVRPEPRRSRVLLWLLAIPAAGLMGALAAALLLPVVFGRGDSSSSAAPEAAGEVPAATPVAVAPALAPDAPPPGSVAAQRGSPPVVTRSREGAPAPRVSSPAPGAYARMPERPPDTSSPTSMPRIASAPAETIAEPAPLSPVAAAQPLAEESASRVVISDDFAVIERNPIPRVLVTQTIWHPRAERRVAVIESLDEGGGAEALRLREGDRVGSLQLVSIEPSGVVFVHNGVELRRRVGARP